MISVDLRDPNLMENFKSIREIQKSNLYSDNDLQKKYNAQIEQDRKIPN
jgi:hypothetical protein